MPKGLTIATNFYNKREAWSDWLNLAVKARAQDRFDLVQKYQPPQNASWRVIDKRIAKLRAELEGANGN